MYLLPALTCLLPLAAGMKLLLANHGLMALVDWLMLPAILALGNAALYQAFTSTFKDRVSNWQQLQGSSSSSALSQFRVCQPSGLDLHGLAFIMCHAVCMCIQCSQKSLHDAKKKRPGSKKGKACAKTADALQAMDTTRNVLMVTKHVPLQEGQSLLDYFFPLEKVSGDHQPIP